jgi:beta-glucanase (GH16 family)
MQFKTGACQILLVITILGNSLIGYAQQVETSGFTKLVWADEFNSDGTPDPQKWGYDLGTGVDGWGNFELQYYTSRPVNAIVQGGVLKINAARENYQGKEFTSAKLLSKNKYEFKYGRVEIRAKLPVGIGSWPAAWMLGSNIDNVGWPACGEIDIMEGKGSEPNKIYGTLAYPGRFGGTADGSTISIKEASSKFHIYEMEWTENAVKISVDGKVYHTVKNTSDSPFHKNFYLILNLAIGGNFAGAVRPELKRATMEVDYVRVYQ